LLLQASETYSSDFLPFFKAHGEKITTLGLDDFVVTGPSFSLITRHCPAIQELTIPPPSFIALEPQTINDLVALRFSMHRVIDRSGYDFDHIVSVMEQCMTLLFERRGKGLKRVQLLNFDARDFRPPLCTKENLTPWKRWIERFEKEQIRFEFDDGKLVKIPSELPGLLR
jgi:hypothetical protein